MALNKKIFYRVTIGHIILIALVVLVPVLKGFDPTPDNLVEVVDIGDYGDGGEALTGETKGDGTQPEEPVKQPEPPAPQPVQKAEPVEEQPEEVSDPEPEPVVKAAVPDVDPVVQPKPKPKPEVKKTPPVPKPVTPTPSTKKTTKDIKISTTVVKGTATSSNTSSTKPATGSSVSSNDVKNRLSGVMKSSVGVIGAGGPGKGGYGGSGVSGSAMANYHGLIKNEIERQWQKPNLDSDKLETAVAIRIQPDGTVRFVSIEKSSGNSEMDQSVQRAVQSVGKLSRALPPGAGNPDYEIVISFKLQ